MPTVSQVNKNWRFKWKVGHLRRPPPSATWTGLAPYLCPAERRRRNVQLRLLPCPRCSSVPGHRRRIPGYPVWRPSTAPGGKVDSWRARTRIHPSRGRRRIGETVQECLHRQNNEKVTSVLHICFHFCANHNCFVSIKFFNQLNSFPDMTHMFEKLSIGWKAGQRQNNTRYTQVGISLMTNL